MLKRSLGAAAIGALLIPAAATAANYPPPHDPGTVGKHPKGKLTLHVCHRGKLGKHGFRSIQKAVNFAGRGDTIRVCNGLYRENVTIVGRRKAGLRLLGNARHPGRVIIDLKGRKGLKGQNGVEISGANNVTVRGFYARHYKGNGFFALNVDGYTLDHLMAGFGGTYGLYAFRSKGGSMTNSEAFYNNDSGFYVGATPPQKGAKKHTFVRHVKAWGNVLGFSGTNMRYVTITQSQWFNNGLGIVPNALTSEPYAPPQDNVITNNDIYWNNFNYFAGAPFKLRKGATGDLAYPVGTGVLLFGGQRDLVTNNRIFGNWLAGAGMIEQVIMVNDSNPKIRAQGQLIGNQIRGNHYGLNGTDLNGHDVAYPGNGSGNCVSESALRDPVGASSFQACPFTGANTRDDAAFGQMVAWATYPDSHPGAAAHENFWVRTPHAARKGVTPLEHCKVTKNGCAGQPRR